MKKIVLGNTPNPRQVEFFKSRARHTAYGGARGGGKSWAMRTKCIMIAARYPGINILLMRRTLPELTENHVIPMQAMLTGYAVYNQSQRVFAFPNGSRIKLGYCADEKDVYQYQGQEYEVIGLEEATHFSEAQKDFITTCNRSVRSDFTPRMYYTCNPGGVGHTWVKRLFIDRDYRASEKEEDYTFIPARVYDNPILMRNNPEYITTLENLPEYQRRAFLDGDWNVIAGQYFSEFRTDMHVVDPFEIPAWWRRYRSMDWGYNDPCAVYWYAIGPDSRAYVYRELYINKTLSRDVAKRMVELSAGEQIDYTAASPDMWQERGQTDIEGITIAEVFAKNGVPLTRADNTRVTGWQNVRAYLANAPDGKPRIQIFSTCRNLIRTLPMMTYDDHKLEDVADGLEDHACESLRYFCMSRPVPNIPKEPGKPKPYNPLETPKRRRTGNFKF